MHEDEFFYTGDFNFVWDKAKNEHNIQCHGVDFKTAALVFNDPFALEEEDKKKSMTKAEIRSLVFPLMKMISRKFPGLRMCQEHC